MWCSFVHGARRTRGSQEAALSTIKPPESPAPSSTPTGAGGHRTLRATRALPGSRAVVGGLLVAVAALGTWYVAAGADRETDTHYLVAARALGPGERIAPADLTSVAADLPEELAGAAFTHPDEIADHVALGPIASGELIQAGSVTEVQPSELAELSFSVEAERAVGGDLRVGDLIDLFDTDERAGSEGTRRVLAEATILDITRPDDGLGRNRMVTITVGVEDPELLPDAVRATRTGTISVVRVTGVTPAGPSSPYDRNGDATAVEVRDGDEVDEVDEDGDDS